MSGRQAGMSGRGEKLKPGEAVEQVKPVKQVKPVQLVQTDVMLDLEACLQQTGVQRTFKRRAGA
jgi:hypothetical protein